MIKLERFNSKVLAAPEHFCVTRWGFDAHRSGRNASWAFSADPWPSQQPFIFTLGRIERRHCHRTMHESASFIHTDGSVPIPPTARCAFIEHRWELLELCRSKITNARTPAVPSYQALDRIEWTQSCMESQKKETADRVKEPNGIRFLQIYRARCLVFYYYTAKQWEYVNIHVDQTIWANYS